MKSLLAALFVVASLSTNASAQFALPLTNLSTNGGVANCTVVNNGYYYQLYIGPHFQLFGTYAAGAQAIILENQIRALIQNGQCFTYNVNFVRTYLNYAMAGYTPNCRVVPMGAYNQLYIWGQLQGNYIRYAGDATLANIMINGYPGICRHAWF